MRSRIISSQELRCKFFFQAEDGIRGGTVTGVQTCALPISVPEQRGQVLLRREGGKRPAVDRRRVLSLGEARWDEGQCLRPRQIGRASCRERLSIFVAAVALNLKGTTSDPQRRLRSSKESNS